MFQYQSTQSHFTQQNGKTTQVTEQVEVKNGKGTITVVKNHNGKKVTKKHPLTRKQIKNIKKRKFMPGLFRPCLDHCDKVLGLPLDILGKQKLKKMRLRNKTRKIHTK